MRANRRTGPGFLLRSRKMTARHSLLAASLCGCLLVALPGVAAEPPRPASAADLAGVDLSALSPEQKAVVASWAKDAVCYCGCPHSVAQCLREHATCRHAKRMASLAARLVKNGAKRSDLDRALDQYYASFDKRARIDVSRFGPPLGGEDAKLTLVEFSDFTCPYCRMVRPGLEAFVRGRADRVKLYYKPYPIESHPGALECAQAAEWARDKGRFWAMHDSLFESPAAHTADDLADLARALGLPPAELRDALADQRYMPRIRESQAEARAAGLRGTPTLYVNGRMLVVTDYSDEGLEHTLADEDEWQANRGWIRD
jgi:protein-disulfide isomerase